MKKIKIEPMILPQILFNGNRCIMKKIITKLKKIASYIINTQRNSHEHLYKIVEIIEKNDEYEIIIRLTNKNVTFTAKPEEILANDALVDHFSQRDIRALTYLGYLVINKPKYKILAKKLSENEKIIFLLKKNGVKNFILKTAEQIINESDMILSMDSEDAKTVGYTLASEAVTEEKREKELLLKDLKKD